MALFENKNQLLMILAALAIGIVASIMIAGFVSSRINEETQRLSDQYQQSQKEKEQQYNEQMGAMNKKIAMVEQNAQKAIEQAAREAEKKQAEAVAAAKAAVPVVPKDVKKPKPSLAVRTPSGKRAITLKIESIGAVGGLINPGDYVDIIANLNLPSKSADAKDKKVITAMIFQRLQILAVNTNLDQPGEYDNQQKETSLRITFAVDPQEAGLLSFAEKNGKLELALRGPNESRSVMLSSATWSSLAEYVLENNGADLKIPDIEWDNNSSAGKIEAEDVVEAKPYIPVYRGGKE